LNFAEGHFTEQNIVGIEKQAYPQAVADRTPLATSRRFSKAPKPLSVREGYVLSRSILICAILAGSLLPAQAHDIYSHLVDGAGASCCDKRDCRPAPYRFILGVLQMFVDERWIDVPMKRVQYRALLGDTGETDGGHWCGSAYEPDFRSLEGLYVTKCAILPPQVQ
jgi:hypothetical protein